MLLSKENLETRNRIVGFDKRIEQMHQDFYNYYNGLEKKLPDWEGLEREMVTYSRRKIYDMELSKNLERVLLKFQNRKKIWLKWAEEVHHASSKGKRISTET